MDDYSLHSDIPDPRRVDLASDPHRPLYHFLSPANWMNDPNGTIYWKGKYHLFYQYNPNGAFHGTMHWGHASSEDLVHWTDLPIALAPTPGGADAKGCYSGGAVDNDGVPTLVYWGVRRGMCIASSDDDMLTWQAHPGNPVIAEPEGGEEWKTHDPCAWREGDTWYMLSGSSVGEVRGIGTSKDAAFMFRSPDMVHWEYVHPLYDPGDESDCAVPDFFPLGDKHMLLFASHTRGAQYYIGTYADQRFTPERHGRMNFTTFDPAARDMPTSGDMVAPISWAGPGNRRIMIAWIAEGRTVKAQRASGWAGVMSLPRVISLADAGTLTIEPVPELEVLRHDHRRFNGLHVKPGSFVPLDITGDCLEMAVEFDSSDAQWFGIAVRRSPEGSEETLISYSNADGHLELDVTRSSLSADVVGRTSQRAPLELAPGEPLKLRIFLDRSVVEIFANSRLCLTKRVYPSRPDSLGVGVFARSNSATLRSMEAWRMASVWPDSVT